MPPRDQDMNTDDDDELDNEEPEYDPEFAKELIGKRMLAAVTKMDGRGNVVDEFHVVGRVVSVDPRKGIRLLLEGSRNGEYSLPPDTSGIEPLEKGVYRLLGSDELVEDPDYATEFAILQDDS